ncbi:aspartate/glutamate racemase family protein [Chryseobacterium sp. MIQD13]|uniref:aspartate/glutamate racemase family protein n=1 Tax=Chryseobacterium sp. MIQD13 TaxID=3422310 RepID=UPI003D28AA45
MKKIGIVGGMTWVSTMEYYRLINKGINDVSGNLNSAECIIYSLNFEEIISKDWKEIYFILLNACKNLEKSGAELIILGANTAHYLADRLQGEISLPIINIISATADAIHEKGLEKVGLLGTKFTMEMDFYRNKLAQEGIQSIIPEKQETRDFIQHIINYELEKEIINSETKEAFLTIIEELIDQGAQGIVLGCTEIPLLIKQPDVKVPVFDTTAIHSARAVASALSLK